MNGTIKYEIKPRNTLIALAIAAMDSNDYDCNETCREFCSFLFIFVHFAPYIQYVKKPQNHNIKKTQVDL